MKMRMGFQRGINGAKFFQQFAFLDMSQAFAARDHIHNVR